MINRDSVKRIYSYPNEAFDNRYRPYSHEHDKKAQLLERVSPREYYLTRIEGTSRPNQQGWSMVRCVLHDDRTPSLSVNLCNGGFKCFGCNASGSNIIDFEMRLRSISFKEALDLLSAEWSIQ